MLSNEINYLSKDESLRLLDKCHNLKYKCLILLMLDAGLRVSEATSIKFKNFDFKKRIITINSLKARKDKYRKIPISDRLYQCLANYLEKRKINIDAENYLFPGSNNRDFICRKTVWRQLQRYSKITGIAHLHPHALRHTFATHHLSHGTQLAEIKEMLGHSSYDTTLIYAAIPTDTLMERVQRVTSSPIPKWRIWLNNLLNNDSKKVINLNFSNDSFTIGRNDIFIKLNDNINKEINTIITGPVGVGKSHILENIETSKKILRLDDTDAIKKTLVQILLYLYKGDKASVMDMVWSGFTIDEIKAKVQRENVTQLCNTIAAIVKPKEYILLIDDISKITPTAKKAIEKLKDAFVIVCAAREIRASDTSFLWNFEKIEVNNLNRNFALQMINNLCNGIETESREILYNHILEQSNGNPRAVIDLVERYKKEPFLTTEVIRQIKHTGALPNIDMSYMIIIFLGIIAATRYIARDLDQPALKFIGALAMILIFISRPLMKSLKQKFI